MKTVSDCRLYTFIDTAYLGGRAPDFVAQQLCDGGSDLIQLRAKHSSVSDIRAMAEKVLPIANRAGVGLVINDHLAIAHEIGAPFCHLGQEDFFDAGYAHACQIKSQKSEIKIGLSTHTPEQATRAIAAGPDYIAIGPVYATSTKPTAQPVTLAYVRWAAQNVKVPWFAIGGINLQNLDDVLGAGAQRVCIVSAILNANDIAAECRKFKERLG